MVWLCAFLMHCFFVNSQFDLTMTEFGINAAVSLRADPSQREEEGLLAGYAAVKS